MQLYTEYFYYHKNPSCCPLIITQLSSCPHCLTQPWQPQICSLFPYFVISRMLHKWNCTVHNPSETGIFAQQSSGDSSRLLHVSSICSFLLMNNSPWYKCSTVCVTIHLLEGILVISVSGYYN